MRSGILSSGCYGFKFNDRDNVIQTVLLDREEIPPNLDFLLSLYKIPAEQWVFVTYSCYLEKTSENIKIVPFEKLSTINFPEGYKIKNEYLAVKTENTIDKCDHIWKEYFGLQEVWNYCEKCQKKSD